MSTGEIETTLDADSDRDNESVSVRVTLTATAETSVREIPNVSDGATVTKTLDIPSVMDRFNESLSAKTTIIDDDSMIEILAVSLPKIETTPPSESSSASGGLGSCDVLVGWYCQRARFKSEGSN